MNSHQKITSFIRNVRNLAPVTLRRSCTHGNCYKFHQLLKSVFPECRPYQTKDGGHVVTRFRDRYYDIYGPWGNPKELRPLKNVPSWESCGWDETYFLSTVGNCKVSELEKDS